MDSIGNYKIIKTIVDKGPSKVCVAKHKKLGRKTFLKIYSGVDSDLVQRFEREGILAIPYRGPTLALMAYCDLGLREFGDLDLLIRRQDLGPAKEMLLGEGFRLAYGLTASQEDRFLRLRCPEVPAAP